MCVCVFQGFVSFLLPCFAVDHLYLSYDEYLLSEEDTPISEGKHLHLLLHSLESWALFTVACSALQEKALTLECVCNYIAVWPSADPDVGRDVLQLVQCLRLVSDAVSPEMAYEMEKALEHLQSPERAAEVILENMLSNDK